MYRILPNEILHSAAVVASARDDFTIQNEKLVGDRNRSDVSNPIDYLLHIGLRASSVILKTRECVKAF